MSTKKTEGTEPQIDESNETTKESFFDQEETKKEPIKLSKTESKERLESLKATDDIFVSFKNDTVVTDGVENQIDKSTETGQLLKGLFWLNLPKSKEGLPIHSSVRGAKVIGMIDKDGQEYIFS